ncbi:DNA replication and repair protein RecF [Kitasatospora sp. MAP12-15]|uniref:DNA replication/repair protein RecF n=1 Tax=unclassified Kitasatospora TaxID=2633591 RepID=UPI00247542E1|nr:DNA replication/repair protein RecF [Kitasatospora sp. MAP12-44]MDH6111892.1 DNA replication and repair protein RecF [Kitasatospora sp. MAP12-44]
MHVAHLSLADFRSYARVEVPLDPGVSAFVGPNGQGKTNLVEAIGYVSTLGSHRVATDAPLIRLGAERAVVRSSIEDRGRTTLVELEITPGKANRARINRSDNVRPKDVLGLLRTVLFAPEDLSLVKGDPGERRRFLDELLTARAPRLAGVRQDYERVLKQRNALLKTAAMARRAGGGKGADLSTLEVWDGHLARAGSELTAFRLRLVDALQPLVAQAYEQLAPGGGPTLLEYRSSFEGALPASREEAYQQLLDALQAARKQETERGLTLVGPHRDELGLKLGPLPAKGYASHGESWSFALALRLASYELLRADGGEPVLILDDVFAELDARRRDQLAELVAGGEQVLVTAAVPEDVPKALRGVRYAVAQGEVHRIGS